MLTEPLDSLGSSTMSTLTRLFTTVTIETKQHVQQFTNIPTDALSSKKTDVENFSGRNISVNFGRR